MTPNKEDYLKCIYEIGTEEGKISNKEIANRMQVSPPAVTEMIKKLISEDLIIKDKVKGYLLTKTGKINVAELYRKHRHHRSLFGGPLAIYLRPNSSRG